MISDRVNPPDGFLLDDSEPLEWLNEPEENPPEPQLEDLQKLDDELAAHLRTAQPEDLWLGLLGDVPSPSLTDAEVAAQIPEWPDRPMKGSLFYKHPGVQVLDSLEIAEVKLEDFGAGMSPGFLRALTEGVVRYERQHIDFWKALKSRMELEPRDSTILRKTIHKQRCPDRRGKCHCPGVI